ncbi:SMC family ATPase [bacterium]|nr:SMC family ATPase [bacterium]
MNNSYIRKLRWLNFSVNRFGTLHGDFQLAPDRLTVLHGENEAGKSTFVAALLAVLYGLSDQEAGVRPQRTHFLPWEGDSFKATLGFGWNDRIFRIDRNFRDQTVHLMTESGENSDHLVSEHGNMDGIGYLLTGGFTPEVFIKSFIVPQEQAALISSPGELAEKVQALTRISPGSSATQSARQILQELIGSAENSEGEGTSILTEKYRLSQNMTKLLEEHASLVQLKKEADHVVRDLIALENERVTLKTRLKSIRRGILLNEKKDLESRHDDILNHTKRLETLQEEEAEYKDAAHITSNLEKKFTQVYERYREAAATAEGAVQERQKRHDTFESEKGKITEFSNLTEFEIEELDDLSQNLHLWKNLNEKRARIEEELDKEKENLAGRGIFARRLELVQANFQILSEETLLEYDRLVAEHDQAEAELRQADERVAKTQLPKRKIRLTPFAISIALIALIAAIGSALEWKLAQNELAALMVTSVAVILVVVLGVLEHVTFQHSARQSKRELSESEKKLTRIEKNLDSLAISINLKNHDELRSLLSDSRDLSGVGSKYFEVKAVHDDALHELESVGEKIRPYLEEAGVIGEGEMPTRGEVDGFAVHVANYRKALEKYRYVENLYTSSLEEERRAADRVAGFWNELQSIFTEAKITEREEVEQAAKEFNVLSSRAQHYRDISEQITTLQSDAGEEGMLNALKSRLEDTYRYLAQLDDVAAEPGTVIQLHELEEQLQDRLHELTRDLSDERAHLTMLQQKIYPAIHRAEHQLASTRKLMEEIEIKIHALTIAADTLKNIESDVFDKLSTMLNEKLQPILAELVPRWSEATFDKDLNLTAKDRQTGKSISAAKVQRLLSAGARDSIFLGARLALSDYLAGGYVDAPYIFDEPFAHLDDNRFRTGMDMLIRQVKNGKQVIVLTCHSGRHREWLDHLNVELRDSVQMMEIERELA